MPSSSTETSAMTLTQPVCDVFTTRQSRPKAHTQKRCRRIVIRVCVFLLSFTDVGCLPDSCGIRFTNSVAAQDSTDPADKLFAVSRGWIYDDFDGAVKLAKNSGKPVMVVIRCPP